MEMFEYCPNVKPENHPAVSGGSDAGLMEMFECCPNVKPENHPAVSGGSDAVAAGEGRFRIKLHEF